MADAKKEQLADDKKREENRAADNDCPICLETITAKTTINACKHCFCKRCIMKWMNQKLQCPVCRKDFDETVDCNGVVERYEMVVDDDDGLYPQNSLLNFHYLMAQRFGRVRFMSPPRVSVLGTATDIPDMQRILLGSHSLR